MTTHKKRRAAAPPTGKEEVVSAVVTTARKLFAERGYAGVSVRDLAEAARVNHGLVHRHFGSKDGVLHAVLQSMFKDVSVAAQANLKPGDPDFAERLYPLAAARKQDWQILMRAVLDGFDFQSAGFEFPLTTGVLEHVAARRGSRNEASRTIAGAIIAGGLGWLLLETYLTPILKLDGADGDKLRERMGRLFQGLVDA